MSTFLSSHFVVFNIEINVILMVTLTVENSSLNNFYNL